RREQLLLIDGRYVGLGLALAAEPAPADTGGERRHPAAAERARKRSHGGQPCQQARRATSRLRQRRPCPNACPVSCGPVFPSPVELSLAPSGCPVIRTLTSSTHDGQAQGREPTENVK